MLATSFEFAVNEMETVSGLFLILGNWMGWKLMLDEKLWLEVWSSFSLVYTCILNLWMTSSVTFEMKMRICKLDSPICDNCVKGFFMVWCAQFVEGWFNEEWKIVVWHWRTECIVGLLLSSLLAKAQARLI